MSSGFLLFFTIIILALGYFVYGRFLKRVFGVDKHRPTPAHTERDGTPRVKRTSNTGKMRASEVQMRTAVLMSITWVIDAHHENSRRFPVKRYGASSSCSAIAVTRCFLFLFLRAS